MLIAPLATSGCTDGGNGGCSAPVGEKWDQWSMAASTYTYCYHGCAVDWLVNNSAVLPNPYAGVVGVDHYWTHQGMPCVGGEPQEFAHQDALAQKWKWRFPKMKFLQVQSTPCPLPRRIASAPPPLTQGRSIASSVP